MQPSQSDGFSSQAAYGSFHQPAVYVSGNFYDTVNPEMQIGRGSTELSTMQGQVIEQPDGTYILHLGTTGKDVSSSGSVLQASPSLNSGETFVSNTDVKFCQQEMQFLHDNFESAENASMPRSIIYNHYTRFCRLASIEPMNAASFGKLVRLVFAGIKTRRLGTRGNSKYHYYGIRIKPSSSLLTVNDDGSSNNGLSQTDGDAGDDGQMDSDGLTMQQREHISFLGDTSSIQLDDLASLTLTDNDLLPEGVSVEELTIFEQMYKEHCREILAHVALMDLAALPKIWQTFWQMGQLYSDEQDDEHFLSAEMMRMVSDADCVQKFVRLADYAFYTILLDVLIPDVLRPIPGSLTLVLRNFSKNLEPWLGLTLNGFPAGLLTAKTVAANAFAQMLRRYTSLNHLAQAARAVLQNSTNVSQMLSDLNKVDFTHIHEQASWVCQCDDRLIFQLETELKRTLGQRFGLEQWTRWLDSITYHILQEHIRTPDFARAARQFLLKWSFYSSLLLRDLTLRSATSFGSFHLIRLLFEEYLFYSVEHKVAAATGISSIATFGDIKQFIDKSTLPPLLLDGFGSPPVSRYTSSQSSSNCTYVQDPSHCDSSSALSVGSQVTVNAATIADGSVVLAMQHPNGQYQVMADNVLHLDDGIVTIANQ